MRLPRLTGFAVCLLLPLGARIELECVAKIN
jgi:hypothetical protein